MSEETSRDEQTAAGPSKTRDIVVVAVVALIALMLGINLYVMLDDGESDERTGLTVPSMELELVGSQDSIDLADFRGTVLVLDFWATWCTSCKEQMPLLERLAEEEASSDDVVFIAVNVDPETEDRLKKVERFRDDGVLSRPTVIDRGPAQSWFRIARLPTLVIVDRSGIVAHVGEGVHEESQLRELIDEFRP